MAHPRMYDDSDPAIQRLRELCLALPEVLEKEAWGECTFRVTGGGMFAQKGVVHGKPPLQQGPLDHELFWRRRTTRSLRGQERAEWSALNKELEW